MISLTYKDINNQLFITALAKLHRFDAWNDAQLKYNIAKMGRRFSVESDLAQEEYIKLVKKYAKLDEKGNPEPISPDKLGTFEIPTENEEAWKKARADFESVKFEIDCHPIPLSKLDVCPLSPAD